MSEFVYLYRSGVRPSRSPEQAQQEMQRWMTWLKDLAEKGYIKDPGHPLERTGKLVASTATEPGRTAQFGATTTLPTVPCSTASWAAATPSSGKLVTGNARTVTDGPFAETKDVVGGYTLVQAADLAQATSLAAGCPIFELADGTVEVRPVMKIG